MQILDLDFGLDAMAGVLIVSVYEYFFATGKLAKPKLDIPNWTCEANADVVERGHSDS
jgi:hypothetical protein